MNSVLKIGLTGGIGAGKSVVSDLFSTLGVPVIDTDVIGRELLLPGSDCLDALVKKLGSNILNDDGSLQRKCLKQLIFENPQTRIQVESVLHPAIKAEMLQQLSIIHSKYCILVVPLLIEKHWNIFVDKVLLVDAPDSIRLNRIRDRDHLNNEQIQQIFGTQISQAERLRNANDIIYNDKDLIKVKQQVNLLHQKYSA